MSEMDFMSALGGAPPAGPEMGMGAPPPELPPEPPPEEEGFSSSLEALDAAEDALHSFIQIDPDEADRAEATKALQIIIKLKASNQESANSGDLTSLQRALQGPGATAGAVQPPAAGY